MSGIEAKPESKEGIGEKELANLAPKSTAKLPNVEKNPAKSTDVDDSYFVGFSPGGSSLNTVLLAISKAIKTIHMAVYEFTNQLIADALVQAIQKGVKVQIVADQKASETPRSSLAYVEHNGAEIVINPHYAIHHHKFIIVDETSIELGSFNYTDGAVEHNAENALYIENEKVAKVYLNEWNRLFQESYPLGHPASQMELKK